MVATVATVLLISRESTRNEKLATITDSSDTMGSVVEILFLTGCPCTRDTRYNWDLMETRH